MSIVKKNLKATKGKKRWRRNIDVTNLVDEVENLREQEKLAKVVQEKMKNKSLYFIDEKPDSKLKAREALDPNRFKKKERELAESEMRMVGKLAHKIKLKEKKKEKKAIAQMEDNEEDPWAEEVPVKQANAKTTVKVPVVLPPHEGQSYNPTYKAHKDLLKTVVEEEVVKEKNKNEIEFVDQKKDPKPVMKKVRGRSLKEQIELDERAKKKFKKQQDHEFLYLKKTAKELNKEEAEHQKKLEERAKKLQEEEELVKEGKMIKTKMLNRNKYEYQGTDFQLAKDLAPNLRAIKVTGSIARDQFDSIFRRNLIEKTSFGKKKRKKSKLPKFKMHSTDRRRHEDEENEKLKVHK